MEKHNVTQISIVTNNFTTIIMNEAIASELREIRNNSSIDKKVIGRGSVERLAPQQVRVMVQNAQLGNLTGQIAAVDDMLHFRPDRYQYWVPVYSSADPSKMHLLPGSRYRVGGHIETLNGQPDHIVIESAEPILN